MMKLILFTLALPALVLSLDRCNNNNPDCSVCTANQVCVSDSSAGIFTGVPAYECENYSKGYTCCNNSECPSGSNCASGICIYSVSANECSSDFDCTGKGTGYWVCCSGKCKKDTC